MSRNRGIAVLVIMALLTLAGPASAHYTIVNGKLVYHSLDCESLLKDWDPTLTAAEGKCLTIGTIVELECANPNGKVVRGTASHPIAFEEVTGPVITDSITKKGKSSQAAGHLKLEVLTDEEVPTLGLEPGEAGCNNNWFVSRALLRQATLTVEVWPCESSVGPDGRRFCTTDPPTLLGLESSQNFVCTLSAEFTLDNPPIDGTAMSCVKSGPLFHANQFGLP